MIDIQNLTVRYNGDQTAIDGLSLNVPPGEFVLLTGPSGCGKSTLARCLNGLIPHASAAVVNGRVVLDGMQTAEHTVAEMAAHVGLVFQNPSTQLFGSTVAEDLAFGPRNLGLSVEEVERRSSYALEATDIQHLRERTTTNLSAGEQQRVAIAAVLTMRPRVLVLDEPTSNLDLKGSKAVLETLHRLRKEYGLTILLIEHRLREAAAFADRMAVMNEGRILLTGTPEEVFAERWLLSGLGIRCPDPSTQPNRLVIDSVERQIERTGVRPLVQLEDVEAGYDSHLVLQGVDFAVYPGEFVALVGDNGAGKTTMARLLAGLLKAQRGRVTWDEGVQKLPLGRRVGLLFQNPLHQLFCDSVEEEISFGPRNFGLPSDKKLEPMLDATGLLELRERNPYALSVGQQQRVALASILALDPALLILDEPTMGQDWGSLSRVMDFLTQLNGHGQAILLITHDHELVRRYADRILLVEHGRVFTVAPLDEQSGTMNGTRERLYEVFSS